MTAEPVSDSVISSIYSAAVGRCDWTLPLDALADHFGLWCLQLIGFSSTGAGYHFSHEGGQSSSHVAALDYVREYHARNPRMPHFLALKPGQWMEDRRAFSPQFVASDPFFQDFLVPHGGCYLSGTNVSISDREVVALAAIRPSGAVPLGDEEIEAFRPVIHHFKEALRVREHVRIGVARLGIASELLDSFDLPMMLIDDTACILFSNQAARGLIAADDAWLDVDGYLGTRHGHSSARLKEALSALDFTPRPGRSKECTLPIGARARDGTNVVAFLSALRPQEVERAFGPLPLVLVTFYDPRLSRNLDPLVVREAFALSPSEARICVELVKGRALDEIAADRQVALATVRTQLQSALCKVGVHRQGELVGVLSGLPAMGMGPRTRR